MKAVTFDKRCYRVKGKALYLNSGEFHYFRVPRADWKERMQLFKEAGGNAVATYIPWLLHEPEEGRFVFNNPEGYLNFEEFVETAAAAGLYVVARPGPYQYSELINAGLPNWICDRYPALMARTPAGEVLNPFSVSYLHPEFMTRARRWFEKICPMIAKHTVSRGGAVAFAQADNELMGVHLWYGGMDYNAETYGIGKPKGRYPDFLKRRYGTIAALNEAYSTQYGTWAEVRPLRRSDVKDAGTFRCSKDYFEMYVTSMLEYIKTLADWMREFGIDVPVIHNSAGPAMNSLFKEVVDGMGPDFLLGSDHYYNLDQVWGQNNPTPQWSITAYHSLELLREMGYPPTVLEMPGGSLSDWPPITADNAETWYLANLAMGMKGHNYYVFTGGSNPPGAGTTSDIYDYSAGIGPTGEIRPLYTAQKRFGRFVKKHSWLAEAEMEYDMRAVFDESGARWVKYAPDPFPEMKVSPAAAQEFLHRGVLSSAFCAGLSPRICDLTKDEWADDVKTPVYVVTSESMSRGCQERILRFLRGGGKAVIGPVLPRLDENLRPCTVLAEALGLPECQPVKRARVRVNIGQVENVYMNGDLYAWTKLHPAASVVGRDSLSEDVLGWSLDITNGGRALVLGFRWKHAMVEHQRMLTELMTGLGLEPKVRCTNPCVWIILRTAGSKSMLFAVNLFCSPMEADISCKPAWSNDWIAFKGLKLVPMSVKTMDVVRPD